jgi:hypothetical protein
MAIGDLTNYSITINGFNLLKTSNISVVELNIYEDLESPTGPFGDISIIDGGDFIGTNSITGNELVFVSFTSEDFPSIPLNLTMSLMQSVNVRPGSSQGTEGYGGGSLYHKEYLWKLCSPAYVWCQGNYVNGDFKDLCSNIMTNVVQYAFNAGCQTSDITTPINRMIARFEHPLKFIDRIIDESISSSHLSSLYVLYYDRNNYIYETYENAFGRSSGITLTMKNILKTSQATLQDVRNQIMWFNTSSFNRPLRPQNKGYVITYNAATGETTVMPPQDVGFPWNVPPNTTKIYDASPPYTTGVAQFVTLSPENTPYEKQLAQAKVYRVAFQAQLAQNHITFQCIGNPSIKIGSTITLNIPDCNVDSEKNDKILSGSYLVKSINHKIRAINQTPRYLMIVEGIKNGYSGVSGSDG